MARDAAGGVINIITRIRAKEKDADDASALRGVSAEQYNLSYRGSKDGFYWDISLQKKSKDNLRTAGGGDADQLHSTNNTYKIASGLAIRRTSTWAYQTYTSNYLVSYRRLERFSQG